MSSTAPSIAIEYFNAPGRAEVARWCLWIANIPFEDIRLSREEFFKRKTAGRYPLGQVPVIHVDGTIYPQSAALMAYAGKVSGFYPSNPKEGLEVDAIIQTINEKIDALIPSLHEQDNTKKLELRKTWASNHGTKLFSYLDSLAKGKNYFVGDKLSIADICTTIVVGDWFPTLDGLTGPSKDEYPNLVKLIETVNGRSDIQGVREKSKKAVEDANKQA